MPNDNAGRENGGLDRRQAQRHDVERPCRVVLESKPEGEAEGVTRNISRSGVLIQFPEMELARVLPRVGEEARVVIDLPPSSQYPPRVLECFARVVRAGGSSKDDRALALEVIRMQIRDADRPEDDAGKRSPVLQ